MIACESDENLQISSRFRGKIGLGPSSLCWRRMIVRTLAAS